MTHAQLTIYIPGCNDNACNDFKRTLGGFYTSFYKAFVRILRGFYKAVGWVLKQFWTAVARGLEGFWEVSRELAILIRRKTR